MSIYGKRQRYDWRRRARRLLFRINGLLACIVLLALLALLATTSANAAPRCPGGGTPDARGRCAYTLSGETCAWPAKLMRVGNVAYCWKSAPAVQP